MKIILELIGITIGAGAVGGAIGYLVRKNVAENKIATAEETAIRIIQEAEQTGKAYPESTIKEASVTAKEDGKLYKVVVTQKDGTETTVVMNEKGEEVK